MNSNGCNNKEIENNISRIVNKHGWHIMKVEATKYLPSFAYTTGLWKNYKHPELISFGLTTDVLHSILNIGGEIVKEGKSIKLNAETDVFFDNLKSYILEVHPRNLKDYFGYGIWFNKAPFPAYQVVWTDRNQKFPWEDNYEEEFQYLQPLLDRNSNFKYHEPKNLGVFTNRHFIEKGNPIVYVEHDKSGDWIFLTADEWLTKDAMLICLEEVVKRDNSLNDLFNLDYGEYAQRKSIKDEWVRNKQ